MSAADIKSDIRDLYITGAKQVSLFRHHFVRKSYFSPPKLVVVKYIAHIDHPVCMNRLEITSV